MFLKKVKIGHELGPLFSGCGEERRVGEGGCGAVELVQRLRGHVGRYAVRRHYWQQKAENEATRDDLAGRLLAMGYEVSFQGSYDNVVALPVEYGGEALQLVCAHYDSTPGTPGADDNASALAVFLEVAELAAKAGKGDVGFVSFNCEEDGLLGSREFVEAHLEERKIAIAVAHVLEMVGYTSHARHSQKSPLGFLPGVPDVGDFIGVVANKPSAVYLEKVLATARSLQEAPPVVGLRANDWLVRQFNRILHSDHSPFWDAGIPAIMWTDTAEFRNPHYHMPSDTPETLDYTFMARVVMLLAKTLAIPEHAKEGESI